MPKIQSFQLRLILAKIHMVTKRLQAFNQVIYSLILAKIHMVTKPLSILDTQSSRLILAKIHMVTKLSV